MGIRIVEELKEDSQGVATVCIGANDYEGIFHKCPETGNVEINIPDLEYEEGAVTVVLDDGNASTYHGSFDKDGLFQPQS